MTLVLQAIKDEILGTGESSDEEDDGEEGSEDESGSEDEEQAQQKMEIQVLCCSGPYLQCDWLHFCTQNVFMAC